MADDNDYSSVASSRASSTRSKADWESRNRNLYSDDKGESGAVVSKEISKKANDIAMINAKRAGAYRKVGRKANSK